jgi:[ribosomal protein S18]-alanine N-acetyltransferase
MIDIVPMTAKFADRLAPDIAVSDPWHRLGIEQASIAKMLTADQPDQMQRAITRNGEPIGAIVIQLNWLLGPYLKHLSIREDARSSGSGTVAVNWLVDFAQLHSQRNIWLCVSQFNERAQHFYSKNGFEITAVLDDLIVGGENEILMRRRLN